MKRRRKIGGPSLVAVPLCWAWRLRRQTQLRSTATKEGRGSRGADLTTGVGLENEELLTKNKSQRVTPLLAQRITLTGNSYFWRTANRQKPACQFWPIHFHPLQGQWIGLPSGRRLRWGAMKKILAARFIVSAYSRNGAKVVRQIARGG
jgi:hypothetical protein